MGVADDSITPVIRGKPAVEVSFCYTQTEASIQVPPEGTRYGRNLRQIAVIFIFMLFALLCLKCREEIGLNPNLFSFLKD